MTITNELLDELEAKAKAATPGSWQTERRRPSIVQPAYPSFDAVCTVQVSNVDRWPDNAAHIAAANPATILALVEHIRSQAERLDMMREAVKDVLWCIDTGPSCQIGVVERCKCSMCVAGRLRAAIAQEGQSHE